MPAQTAVLDLLGRHPLLQRLAAEDLKCLVATAAVRVCDTRGVLLVQGEEGQSVLVVVSGFVKLAAITAGGREVVLDVVGPGEVLGELAVLTDQPRAATATALTPCSVLAIGRMAFISALMRAPEAMLWIIQLLARRLAKTTERMTDGLELPAPVRLAKALLQLAALHAKPTERGLQISLTLSQRELGEMTGLIRESINKHLGQWREAGWLSLNGRVITLHQVAALNALLREEGM